MRVAVPWPPCYRSRTPPWPSILRMSLNPRPGRAAGYRRVGGLPEPACRLLQPFRAWEAVGARLGARLRRRPGARRALGKPVMPAPPGPGRPAAWGRGREMRKRLWSPGRRGSAPQHRGCTGQPTGNFPAYNLEPVQTSQCRSSLNDRRFFFPSFSRFSEGLQRSGGS